MTAHGLIDTTEMYLRTIFELEEEGIVPLRARIAERLQQSGPTVSQTVARMERDGLVRVEGDRHLTMTDLGRTLATRVMRKHRLAECLLTQVIGLPWEEVHIEACRWEHVMSESVEARLVTLLNNPVRDPHGNPIPGLEELGVTATGAEWESLPSMAEAAGPRDVPVVVRRISEQVQSDPAVMLKLKQVGIQPGREVTLAASDYGVRVIGDDATGNALADLPREVAAHVFVSAR
ncbi:metal-dependent transcriptional regulator [Planomonospora sp. ID91781]|uniref:DtxR family transcriptional regulator n=3 Tax=Planomonospora TaxID=1998 RepID=A0A161LJ26_9ACTN|nr:MULTISPECIES: metal-dependent transcriptional regulator [Planomonospora]MBG0820617.1 metal-dependent transcriptional regulator [Planomonospora sp. ID91781]GAT66355.1 dtxR family transcriptional regulator [Planomonospora sphaerica]GGK54676.1 iron-dependent repressor IdeR [Planomonospora parontospora]GII07486.1 iron-dependent repressor IdeR [Planomonospora parontospora subsp. parontospora]